MKLKHLLPSLVADFKVLIEAHNITLPAEMDMKLLHALRTAVSINRSYDDDHPNFASGAWKRSLPYDGRDYCFWKQYGADDRHVETLLKAVWKQLKQN